MTDDFATTGDEVNPLEAKLKEKLAAKRAAKEASAPSVQPAKPSAMCEQDIPDLGSSGISEFGQQQDRLLKELSIIDAYNKWCGKTKVGPTSRKEGIKVSCPDPAHPDKNPSAWLNTEKNVYNCEACARGGDVYDIAAYHFGYDVPGYKAKELFPKLKNQMCESLGLVKPVTVYSLPAQEPTEEPEPTSVAEESAPQFKPERQAVNQIPTLDVRKLMGDNNFVAQWVIDMGADGSVPDVFNFFTALQLVGQAPGRKVTLERQRPVHANVNLVLTGDTSSGKTTAESRMQNFMRQAMPYDFQLHTGVKLAEGIASGEALIASHRGEISDPTNPKAPPMLVGVQSVISYNEFSGFITRRARVGNTLEGVLFKFLDIEKEARTESTTNKVVYASDFYASFFSTTQPKLMQKMFNATDTASGLINRLWFPMAGPMDRDFIDDTDDDDLDYGPSLKRYEEITQWVNNLSGSTAEPLRMKYTKEARDLANQWSKEWLVPTKEEDTSGILERLPVSAKKLMLLWAINTHSDIIEVRHVEFAIEVVKFLYQCYAQMSWRIMMSEEQALVDAIIERIPAMVAAGKEPTRQALWSALHTRFRVHKMKDFSNTLEQMVEFGLLAEPANPGGGRGNKATGYTVPKRTK